MNYKGYTSYIDMDKRCSNCFEMNHFHRNCPYPKSSYGIIPFKTKRKLYFNEAPTNIPSFIKDNIFIGMIRRRFTFSYVDFLRGIYKKYDYDKLKNLVLYFTPNERDKILHHTFGELWRELWLHDENVEKNNEFYHCERKFNLWKEGVSTKALNGHWSVDFPKQNNITLVDMFKTFPAKYNSPEWGFPKGKKNLNENEIQCAKREFGEETGLPINSVRLIREFPILEEVFLGENEVVYRHFYFVGKCARNTELKMDYENVHQKSEIGDIKWVNYNQAISLLRDYHESKRKIIWSFYHQITQYFYGIYLYDKKCTQSSV